MIRLLVFILLTCFVCAASSLIGCTTQKVGTSTSEPWPPDTLWFIKTSGTTYSVYTKWPPDTMETLYDLTLMTEPAAVASLKKIVPEKKFSKAVGAHALETGEHPFPPWPPDTMRFARVRLLGKSIK